MVFVWERVIRTRCREKEIHKGETEGVKVKLKTGEKISMTKRGG